MKVTETSSPDSALERKSPLRFLKDTLLYSGGSFVGRLATLFFLPLTTSYLTPGDYGIIGVLTLLPIFMNSLFSLGFHTSLGRVYSTGKDDHSRAGIIWTAFIILILNNLLLTSVAILFAQPLSLLLLGTTTYSPLVVVTFIGIGVCTIRMSFEYYLRASGQSTKVFFLNILDACCSISIMLYQVVHLKRGAAGYMEAFAIAQSINLGIIFCVVAPTLKFSIQWEKIKELIKIGLPCIYGYWGFCILQGASRYLLPLYSSEEQAGLYFLGSNLGRIIELPLWGFMSAWVPFFNSYLDKQEEAPPVFSKMMSFYLIGMCCLLGPLFCLAKMVVTLFLQPPFHDVWKVVGLTGLAQALWGAYAITYPPLIFKKKTGVQSCLELAAALFCVLANILLIPLFQAEGAAIATLLGFTALICGSLFINGRIMPIPYEKLKFVKLTLGLGLVATVSFVPAFSLYITGITLILFYCFMWYVVLSPSDRITIVQIIKSKRRAVLS